jgi:hypothetical protein
MTIHFAAAIHSPGTRRFTRSQARVALGLPANDNQASAEIDGILHAALRQFARHGIGAAAHARGQAERAFFAGDRETYQWWLGICRTLDRKLATGLVDHARDEKA